MKIIGSRELLEQTRTVTSHESQLTDETATSKHPRASPTLSILHRQEKRIALRELINHEGAVHEEPRATLRLAPRRLISRTDNIVSRFPPIATSLRRYQN